MKKKDDELFIKEINEYTIDKKTYKGSCKTFKVVKILKAKDEYSSDILILENGQRVYIRDIYDLDRNIHDRYHCFDDTLELRYQVLTIEKIPNIKNIFKRIKENQIKHVSEDIKCIKSDISKCEKSLVSLNKRLEEKTVSLKLLEGN